MNIKKVKQKVKKVISPIAEVNKNSKSSNLDERTDGGRELPEQFLIYFLLHDLLGFKAYGQFEKIAWAIPIDYKGKTFMISHRKFGVGIFSSKTIENEKYAREIVQLIKKGINAAEPYFEHLIEEAILSSKLNLENRNYHLY